MAAAVVGPTMEDGVVKEGLQRLRDAVGDAGLLELPKRPNGSQLLLKQGHFERLLNGTLDLLSFPMADVVDMQADIKHLTLSQLLYIRCSNLGFAATTQSVRAQGDFLDKVDAQLDIRLAARLAGGRREFTVEPSKVQEVARLTYLIYGARSQVEGAGPDSLWLFRAGALEGLLRLQECQLEPLGQSRGVFCHRSLARNPAGAPRMRRQLHWEVEVSDSPATFDSTPPARPSRAQNLVRPSQRLAEASSAAEGYPAPEGVPPHVRAQMEQALAAAAAARQEAAQSASELDEARRELESVRAELAAAKAGAEAAAGAAEATARSLRAELVAAQADAAAAAGAHAAAAAAAESLRAELATAQAEAKAAAGASAAAETAAESLRAELATAQAEAKSAADASAAAENAAEALKAELATAQADAAAAAGARAAAEAAAEALRAELAAAQADAAAAAGARAAAEAAAEALRAELAAAQAAPAASAASVAAAPAAAPAAAQAPPCAPAAAAAAGPAPVPEEILRAFPGAQVVVQPMTAHSR